MPNNRQLTQREEPGGRRCLRRGHDRLPAAPGDQHRHPDQWQLVLDRVAEGMDQGPDHPVQPGVADVAHQDGQLQRGPPVRCRPASAGSGGRRARRGPATDRSCGYAATATARPTRSSKAAVTRPTIAGVVSRETRGGAADDGWCADGCALGQSPLGWRRAVGESTRPPSIRRDPLGRTPHGCWPTSLTSRRTRMAQPPSSPTASSPSCWRRMPSDERKSWSPRQSRHALRSTLACVGSPTDVQPLNGHVRNARDAAAQALDARTFFNRTHRHHITQALVVQAMS
jgi:hypothetical protein